MKLSIAVEQRPDAILLEISPVASLGILKEMLQAETGINAVQQEILFSNRILIDNAKSLAAYEVEDGARIFMRLKRFSQPTAFDPYAHEIKQQQQHFEKALQQQALNENLANALEFHPEAFVPVDMLYVECEVNRHPLRAFVDTGAQKTIISEQVAKGCDILHLLDVRFAGMATGVGQQPILGVVHGVTIRIGGAHVSCSVCVMREVSVGFIFGLDMLQKHGALLDLSKRIMTIGGFSVPFVADRAPVAEGAVAAAYAPEFVDRLVELGATREAAIAALDAADGNIDGAVAFFFDN